MVVNTVELGPSTTCISFLDIHSPTLQTIFESGVLEQQCEVITGLHLVALDEVEDQLLNVILALVDLLGGEGVVAELALHFGVVLVHGVSQFYPSVVLEHLLQQSLEFATSAEEDIEFLISSSGSVEGISSGLEYVAGSEGCLVVGIAVEHLCGSVKLLLQSFENLSVSGYVGVGVFSFSDSTLQFYLGGSEVGLTIIVNLEVVGSNPVSGCGLSLQTECQDVRTSGVHEADAEVFGLSVTGGNRGLSFVLTSLNEDRYAFSRVLACSI